MKKEIKMSFDTIMQIIGVLVLPIVGFLHKETTQTKRELADFKTRVAEKYAMKEEIKRIEDKLDSLYNLIIERLPKRSSK